MSKPPVWLILLSTPPYFDTRTEQGLDAVLACGAFGQQVNVVFMGLGIEQLRGHQQPSSPIRHIAKLLSSLPLYDIDEVSVVLPRADIPANSGPTWLGSDNEHLQGLTVKFIQASDLSRLISSADHVLSF